MTFHSLIIKEVTKITPQAVEILFKIPEVLQSDFKFVSGQYLTLKAQINDSDVRRAYSISSVPSADSLSVVVKQVDHGIFSNYAMGLRAGDAIDVSAPDGLFVYEESDRPQTILAIAAGSGITPIISIVKSALTQNENNKVALIYGNQSVAQTIYYEQLNDLKDQFSDRFVLKYSFSREERDEALFGRINKGNLNYFLKQDCKDWKFDSAFLCGPEEMINETSANLVDKEYLKKEDVKFELFSTADADVEITEDSHLSEIKVLLDDEELSFTMKRDENMLDVMLRNDIDAPYSCQGGICSSCICIVEEGEVQLAKNSILTDGEIEQGYTLACQAYPKSALVKVNFDDA